MKKTSVSSNSLGTFLSPSASSYIENGGFNQKGWSSERVPHPSTATTTSGVSRRHVGSASAVATPFYSGRTLPSKWEDAERWICSPVAAYPGSVCKNSSVNPNFSEQRRPKSKSGPIVPPTVPIGCFHYSPGAMQMREAAQPESLRSNLMVGSPFSTGVFDADRVYRGKNTHGDDNNTHGWIDLVSESSSSSSQEGREEENKETETTVSPVVVSRRDMATQMSPEANSPNQSFRERGGGSSSSPFYPSPPLILSVVSPHREIPSKTDVREVKVDKRAKMIKRSKRRGSSRNPPEAEVVVPKNAASAASASSWDISEPAMSISKLQREEAKIAAWENLQKAKAEAAIRKLEVKLEKKKSASIGKILNKLQSAEIRAQEMRSSISNRHDDQTPKSSHKIMSFRRHTFMNSFTSCFAGRVNCRSSSSVV